MFVTFQESPSLAQGNHIHNGSTVSILVRSDDDLFKVGRWNSSGEWVTWIAHTEELTGFNTGEIAA